MPRSLPCVLALLLVLVAGCGGKDGPRGGDATPDPVAALVARGTLFPLVQGMRWTYDARMGDRTWEIRSKKIGGDVRERGGRKIRYEFTYADLGDELRDAMKSIFATPPEGPEEFYLDAFHVSLLHDPPLPLLPPEPRVGVRWTWTGVFALEPWSEEKRERTMTQEVVGIESVVTPAGTYDALRIDESDGALRIARWFAPGVGLVRLAASGTLDGTPVAFELVLRSFAPG